MSTSAAGDSPYQCITHGPKHDLFISYRVATEAATVQALKELFNSAALRRYKKPLTIFHDVDCLSDADDWRDGFMSALPKSGSAILLISQGSMNMMKDRAKSGQDNVVLEIEKALELKDENSNLPVLPLAVATKGTKDGVDVYTPFQPDPMFFNDPAFGSLKKIMSRLRDINVRSLDPTKLYMRVYYLLTLIRPLRIESWTKRELDERHFCDPKFWVDPAHLQTLLEKVTLTGRAIISGTGGMGK
ncbi:uncharacterized protein BJ171DRAFT_591293 [Polychytrium aggregatum]|uniref:uncharacterized protein n=1 Tax=Polychytrium aggregatum TaxID=110093 RepID=UPI0022FE16E9|nr:uncharacterized protein BJ171DRAFT_591293 [Polychytrium aggregatum]KAI9190712.1 hypothetical protein BJ171DRAFT_591293 [Polychytrium aggregatum]